MKKQFKISTTAVFLTLALTLSSCCSTCNKKSPQIGNLESATWALVEVNQKPVEGVEILLSFDAEKKLVSGQCPCNNFFGGYTLTDDKTSNIKFGNMGATMKMCPDTQIEEEFSRTINSVTNVKIDGENLMMFNEKGALVAVLAATQTATETAE